jgi:septal ring factor EnvC (AmiA/AmiB activator)
MPPLAPGFLLVLISLAVVPCFAADAGQAAVQEQRLGQLRSRIHDLKKDLEAAQGRKNSVDAELEKTEKEIGAVASALQQLEGKIAQSHARRDKLDKERRTRQRNLEEMRSVLAHDLRLAYQMGQQQRVKLLLNQDDPAAITRLMVYYGYFSRARAERIARIESALDELALVEQKVKKQQSRLEKLKAEKIAQSERLQRARTARQAVLKRLQAELRQKSSELTDLARDEKQLQHLVEALRRALKDIPPETARETSRYPLKGKLVWPVDGPIRVPFGAEQADGKLHSRGILVNASAGADVHAIAGGRVLFADWLRGFGLLLIVDHGQGYMSLYGYNRSLYKEVGDKVEAGDVIAAVGDSGGRARSGLYLELRKDGQPFDPLSWFAGKRSRLRAGN